MFCTKSLESLSGKVFCFSMIICHNLQSNPFLTMSIIISEHYLKAIPKARHVHIGWPRLNDLCSNWLKALFFYFTKFMISIFVMQRSRRNTSCFWILYLLFLTIEQEQCQEFCNNNQITIPVLFLYISVTSISVTLVEWPKCIQSFGKGLWLNNNFI